MNTSLLTKYEASFRSFFLMDGSLAKKEVDGGETTSWLKAEENSLSSLDVSVLSVMSSLGGGDVAFTGGGGALLVGTGRVLGEAEDVDVGDG